jgi:hypothetical protein
LSIIDEKNSDLTPIANEITIEDGDKVGGRM